MNTITATIDDLNRASVLSDEPYDIGNTQFAKSEGEEVALIYAGQTGYSGRIVRKYSVYVGRGADYRNQRHMEIELLN